MKFFLQKHISHDGGVTSTEVSVEKRKENQEPQELVVLPF